ncbi:hypothetical protein AOL_s00097g245 [Orbilia oligospora ATCC 24927]|uniref:Uncharacterized protein n=1 Tax=Arthrobotrys oligospora (strain ATCC 24927 / CBS 115.81 / DSM 1491) TaxID=756982 RepID=G1XIR8_ARTOA|nr:hypothetical protein AOL_s00097g245 [Orbilia oligospora ATCC 24927]EGX46819.1 hypothetical protein AOL_s00097g245 [Orbilia oligospora ATCC 24927]
MHNGALAVLKDCHDVLSSGFDKFERGLDRVENQPEAVERRLGSLEKKVDEYAPKIVNNSGARQFNSHARKKTSTLEPLLTVRFDENRRVFYPVPPGFPQSVRALLRLRSNLNLLWELMKFYNIQVARENSPPSHVAADSQELDSSGYTIMDLGTFEEVRDYPEECFETFVTWIGVKMKVVEALMDS